MTRAPLFQKVSVSPRREHRFELHRNWHKSDPPALEPAAPTQFPPSDSPPVVRAPINEPVLAASMVRTRFELSSNSVRTRLEPGSFGKGGSKSVLDRIEFGSSRVRAAVAAATAGSFGVGSGSNSVRIRFEPILSRRRRCRCRLVWAGAARTRLELGSSGCGAARTRFELSSNSAQDGPKTPPRWPKIPQDTPRWPQVGPKMAQDARVSASLKRKHCVLLHARTPKVLKMSVSP